MTTWNDQTLTHDAAGNLSADAQWAYRYDTEHRLVSLIAAQGAYGFGDDAWGRRVIDAAGGGTDTRHLKCVEAIRRTPNANDVPTRYHYPQPAQGGLAKRNPPPACRAEIQPVAVPRRGTLSLR